MDWFILVPYVAVALASLLIPGLLVGAVTRLRGWALVQVAPVLSVTIISVAAIVAQKIHLSWGWLPVAAVTVILVVVILAVDLAGRSLLPRVFRPTVGDTSRADGTAAESARRRIWIPATALAVAAVIAIWQFMRMVVSPGNFSQTYDNIFHMNVVRWILDTHDASSLSVISMISGGQPPTFYPAAWHDLVSLVNLTLGSTNIAYSSNAVNLVIMAVVWPLACLFLASRLFPAASVVLRVTIGILASSFAAFPSLLIGFGVLFPNFLGFSLLPVLLGLAASILGLAPSRLAVPAIHAVVMFLACLPGLFIAHPNAFLSLVAMMSPMGLTWAYRGVRRTWRSRRVLSWAYMGATVLALGVFAVIWRLGYTQPSWGPPNSSETSIGEILLASPLLLRPFWVLGVLIVAGLIWLVRTPSLRWWAGPSAVVCVLWWAVSAMHDSLWRNLLVAGYYNDPYRLAALLPMILFPITIMGAQQILAGITAWLGRRPRLDVAWVRAVAVVCAGLILVGGVQFSAAMGQHIAWVKSTYVIDENSALVDADEYALIQQLPDLVPAGVRVATDPWNGSSMAYALENIPTTTTHVGYTSTPDLDIINNSLVDAVAEPSYVCPAVKDLNVGYVLDFGDKEVHGAHHPYPGFDDLSGADGFALVAQVGHASLYRVDACG
ncbi:MAG: hypothetical protein FWD75_08365 [Propionibacteriaceae bacterium]|nr:hypothetical protein [Propionibacteriaceae bacterium]